ncbi:MAG: DNA cytosine methyltransferase [Nitrososphaeria archaeon]
MVEEVRFPQRVDSEWTASIAKYWRFVEKFRSHSVMGRGDARAYVSALTDIIAVEEGVNNVNGMKWAFGEAVKTAYKEGLTKERYTSVLQKWMELDRTQLRAVWSHGEVRSEPHILEKECSLNVVSLFTGSYGLDLGFEYAGFCVAAALDIDPISEQILTANRPKVPFILDDIARVPTKEILAEAKLSRGEVDVLVGGPPCQPFSTAGRRQGLGDPRASPLKEFIRVVNEAQPKAFVMEEVTGLLNARLKHVPIKDRDRKLLPEELPGSVWRVVLEELGKTGYKIAWGVLNAADFGAPQIRQRVIVIGIRKDLGIWPRLPIPTHTKPGDTLFSARPWKSLLETIVGVDPGEYIELPPKYTKYMKYVPPGGNWRQIPSNLVADAMNNAFIAGGGRMGFYRRLSLFEPSPTLVTSPIMKGSMLIHPVEDRPLGVNEYKVIQGFPQDWTVPGSATVKYRKIGEAVPPLLSYAVASSLREDLMKAENDAK